MKATRGDLARMFCLVLPYCFSASMARSIGLGGLRKEAGGKMGHRPFHAVMLTPPDYGTVGSMMGPRPEMPAIFEMIMRRGILSQAQVVEVAKQLDYGTAAQRELLRLAKKQRHTKRNNQQVDLMREFLAARRAAKAVAAVALGNAEE